MKQDTTYVDIKSSKNSFFEIQNKLGEQTLGVLKIRLSGKFYLGKSLISKRKNVVLSFNKGAKIIFTSSVQTGFLIKHDNISVINGQFEGNGVSSNTFYSGYGIFLYGVKNCVIKNNTFNKISGINIYLGPNDKNQGCKNNLIEKNRIYDPRFYFAQKGTDEAGILLGYSGYGYAHKNNTIRNNYIDGNNVLKIGTGIIGHGSGNIFEANTIKNCLNYGVVCYESQATDVSLSNNKVLYNVIENIGEIGNRTTVKGMGIYLMKSHNSSIIGNKVCNTLRNSDKTETLGAGAISTSGSLNVTVSKNEIVGSNMYGYTNDYGFNSTFADNTIANVRKSAIYLINVSNIIVSNNKISSVGEVVLKGYFENTALPYIKNQWKTDLVLNKVTGKGILIRRNKIYSNNQLLYFRGTKKEELGIDNAIGQNEFTDNEVYYTGKFVQNEEMIAFRVTDNTNIIKDNIFKELK